MFTHINEARSPEHFLLWDKEIRPKKSNGWNFTDFDIFK